MQYDPELTNFASAQLESMAQAKRGEHARVNTPGTITTRRGRPVGRVEWIDKTRLNLQTGAVTLDALRVPGKGWQTRLPNVVAEAVTAGQI